MAKVIEWGGLIFAAMRAAQGDIEGTMLGFLLAIFGKQHQGKQP